MYFLELEPVVALKATEFQWKSLEFEYCEVQARDSIQACAAAQWFEQTLDECMDPEMQAFQNWG